MTTYKVYKKGNYIIFEYLNVTGAVIHVEEEAADLLYKRDANNLITLTSKRTNKLYILKQGNVNKETDVAYTEVELETFLSENTGVSNSSSGGGGVAGDASAANQVIGNTKLTSIDNKVATETTLVAINTKTATLVSGRVPVDGSGVTQPISAASLPLPTGAATSANQTTSNSSLSSIDGKVTGIATAALQSSTNTKLDLLHTDLTAPIPTGTNAIGQVTANAGTNLNTSTLALEATQALVKAKTDNLDVTLSTRATEATLSTLNTKVITTANGIKTDGSSVTQPVSAISLPLPTGAATESTLSTLNTKVTAVNTGAVTISTAIPSGNNLIGKVGIDQTTPGTTNKVNIGTDGVVGMGSVIFQYSAEGANSSTVQLASSAIFTGTIEGIPNQPAFSVLLFSDQNGSLTINQFIDAAGTQKVYAKTYTYTANSQFPISAAANGNFFQAIFQNTGGSTTTKFNLNTAYGIIDSATILNNKPHSLNELNGAVISTGLGASDAGTQRHALVNEQVQDLYFTGQSTQTAIINNIIPTTSSATATDVTGFSSGSIQIVSTGTAGTFIFEGTNDSPTSTNFQTIPVWNEAVQTGTPITAAITATASAIIYIFPVNFRYLRVRIVTTITGGSIQAFSTIKRANFTGSAIQVAQATAANLNVTTNGGTISTVTAVGTINTSIVPGVAATHLGKAEDAVAASGDTGVFALGVRRDTLTVSASATGDYNEIAVDKYGNPIIKDQRRHKRTYSSAFNITPAALATDLFQLIGSATTTVSITKISITATQTTGSQVIFNLIKRSSANTGGTFSTVTMVPNDASDAAATAVGTIYSANPTTGSGIGLIRNFSSFVSPTSTQSNVYTYDFGDSGKPIVLSGVAQALVLSLGGVTIAGGAVLVWIEFTEE